MKPKALLRWATVLSLGGLGFYFVVEGLAAAFRDFARGDVGWSLFEIFFMVVMAAVPLAISYFVFQRQYRHVTILMAAVSALLVYSELAALPKRFGLLESFAWPLEAQPWRVVVGLPLSLLCFLGPFYAAAWFFRLCLRLADRYLLPVPPGNRSA